MSRIGDSSQNELISQLRGFLRDNQARRPGVGTVARVGLQAVNVKLTETGTLLRAIDVIGGVAGLAEGDTLYLLYFADNRVVGLRPGDFGLGDLKNRIDTHTHPALVLPPSGGGGINSPIFVPAIGGNWDALDDAADRVNGPHARVYGGGPYVGGALIEFYQIGISFEDGGYHSPFTSAFGIFTVPDGVTHIKLIPQWITYGVSGCALHFFGELIGQLEEDGSCLDDSCCNSDAYAYGEATIHPSFCDILSVPVATLETDARPREIIRVYADSDSITVPSGLFGAFMLGWQAYLS